MAIFQFGDKRPQCDPESWIAPGATVIGEVRLARNVSVWFNAVIRGDNDLISIGENCNIQDGAVLHTDEGIRLTLAANVTVGHQAMLHGCTIGEGSLIGIQAIVLNEVVIGKDCLIGANALLPDGRVIPDRSLVLGSPGKVVRTLSDEEIAFIRHGCQHYVERSKRYRRELQRLPE